MDSRRVKSKEGQDQNQDLIGKDHCQGQDIDLSCKDQDKDQDFTVKDKDQDLSAKDQDKDQDKDLLSRT